MKKKPNEAFYQPKPTLNITRPSNKTGGTTGDKQRLAYNQYVFRSKTSKLNHKMYEPESGPQIKARQTPRSKVVS